MNQELLVVQRSTISILWKGCGWRFANPSQEVVYTLSEQLEQAGQPTQGCLEAHVVGIYNIPAPADPHRRYVET